MCVGLWIESELMMIWVMLILKSVLRLVLVCMLLLVRIESLALWVTVVTIL